MYTLCESGAENTQVFMLTFLCSMYKISLIYSCFIYVYKYCPVKKRKKVSLISSLARV